VPASNKLIFIMAGQSNMAGRVILSSDCSPAPSVLRLSPSLRWEQVRQPHHHDLVCTIIIGISTLVTLVLTLNNPNDRVAHTLHPTRYRYATIMYEQQNWVTMLRFKKSKNDMSSFIHKVHFVKKKKNRM
jgi:hypothetical protein